MVPLASILQHRSDIQTQSSSSQSSNVGVTRALLLLTLKLCLMLYLHCPAVPYEQLQGMIGTCIHIAK